jgi:chromosome segregation ATPase
MSFLGDLWKAGETISGLSARLAVQTEQISQLCENIGQLTTMLEALRLENKDLLARVTAAETRLDEKDRVLANLTADHASLAKECSAIAQRVAAAETAIAANGAIADKYGSVVQEVASLRSVIQSRAFEYALERADAPGVQGVPQIHVSAAKEVTAPPPPQLSGESEPEPG